MIPQEPEYKFDDEVLKFLLGWVNRTDLVLKITLQVGGTWLAGELISETSYTLALADKYASSLVFTPSDADESMIQEVRFVLNEMVANLTSTQDTKISHLHLKDFFFYYPVKRAILSEFPYCRVLLSEVSAWTLGAEPQPYEQT